MDKDLGLNLRSILIIFLMIVAYDHYRWYRPFQKEYEQHMESATLQIKYLKTESETQEKRIRELSRELADKSIDTVIPRIIHTMHVKDSVVNDTVVRIVYRVKEKVKIIDK